MNKRLRELAEQNDCTVDGMGYGEGNIEGFANAIIDECVNVCLARRNPPNLNYKPSVEFADDIKRNFDIYE